MTPLKPRAHREKPTVAPTMVWVPEMGSLKKVATKFQMELPPVGEAPLVRTWATSTLAYLVPK